MRKTVLYNVVFVAITLLSCYKKHSFEGGLTPPDHEPWGLLLSKHVHNNGIVDYRGFADDSLSLKEYLDLLKNNPPDDDEWTQEEQLAYWINAYNAYTVKLILDHYPLKSIKDIGSSIQIPLVNSPWDIKFIEIGDEMLDLNNIEHDILRKEFDEPRIHFAINCASKSCPKLRNEAYSAEKLNQQLNDQAVDFINDPAKNKITKNEIIISKIFSWFQGDFTKRGSLIEFLNQYGRVKADDKAKIGYAEYDWKLNDQ